MAGSWLIDAWKLFNASKGVAQQHIKLRSQQLDVFNKTSSLAKAAKSQTDRITLTLEAARALSQRLNEEVPRYAQQAAQRATAPQSTDIPRTDTVRAERPRKDTKTGLEQDHHYDRSARNTKAGPLAEDELGVKQEEAERTPLPDGTIHYAGITLNEGRRGQDTFSERPVHEPPKNPLADEQGARQKDDEGIRPVESGASTIPLPGKPTGVHTETTMSVDQMRAQHEDLNQIPSHANEPHRPAPAPKLQQLHEGHDRDVFYSRSVESKQTPSSSPKTQIPKHTETDQESDSHVRDEQLNQDVYYSVPEPAQEQMQKESIPHRTAVPEQQGIPEGINTDVFRTKRVSKMLGGNPYQQKPSLDLRGAARTPRDRTDVARGHDQDTFNVRRSEESWPAKPEEPVRQSPTTTTETVREKEPKTTEQEIHELASQLAKDAEAAQIPVSEVCPSFLSQSHMKRADILTA